MNPYLGKFTFQVKKNLVTKFGKTDWLARIPITCKHRNGCLNRGEANTSLKRNSVVQDTEKWKTRIFPG